MSENILARLFEVVHEGVAGFSAGAIVTLEELAEEEISRLLQAGAIKLAELTGGPQAAAEVAAELQAHDTAVPADAAVPAEPAVDADIPDKAPAPVVPVLVDADADANANAETPPSAAVGE